MATWFGRGWATPVVRKRWAFAATVLQWVKQASRYRLGNKAFGYAWHRAITG